MGGKDRREERSSVREGRKGEELWRKGESVEGSEGRGRGKERSEREGTNMKYR